MIHVNYKRIEEAPAADKASATTERSPHLRSTVYWDGAGCPNRETIQKHLAEKPAVHNRLVVGRVGSVE